MTFISLKSKQIRGFTLVELLVVISIISLLMSITLPALNNARAIAREAVCSSNLRSVGTALASYVTDWNDYLPGPNTSGSHLTRTNDPRVSDISGPVQNVDWITPLFGRSLGIVGTRKDRIAEIFDTRFRCPANRSHFDVEYSGGGSALFSPQEVTSMTASSYSASLAFHVNSVSNKRGGVVEAVADRVAVPRTYSQRFLTVGRHSEKIFAFDGTRYIDPQGRISFNSFAKQIQGGNYMAYGPAVTQQGDPFRWKNFSTPEFDDDGITEKHAYRHRGKINAVFFDGHVRSMTPKESLNVNYYWPRGSTVRNARWIYDKSTTNGAIR